MNITQALKGIGGEFELNRVIGATGALAYIIAANAFEAWEVLGAGKSFDLATYCVAFPAGLGVVVGAVSGAVALKERQVAKAKGDTP